jgi:hypothetical protein
VPEGHNNSPAGTAGMAGVQQEGHHVAVTADLGWCKYCTATLKEHTGARYLIVREACNCQTICMHVQGQSCSAHLPGGAAGAR